MALIETEQLTREYQVGHERVRALAGVDLSVAAGEYVAIMGQSGCGKSTLMNVLGCLDSPSAGSYRLNGQEVAGLTDTELAHVRNKEIGFVFQTFHLLPRISALENVEMPLTYARVPRPLRRARAVEVLTQVGLADRMHHQPNELSGGQRQRVAIARALVNRPSIVLADEPTGNLDSNTSREILALFKELHRSGITLLLVTHDESIARNADRILRMRDGRIVADEVQGGMG